MRACDLAPGAMEGEADPAGTNETACRERAENRRVVVKVLVNKRSGVDRKHQDAKEKLRHN